MPTTDPGSGKAETRRKLWPNFFANWPLSVRAIRYLANTGPVPKRRFVESGLNSPAIAAAAPVLGGVGMGAGK